MFKSIDDIRWLFSRRANAHQRLVEHMANRNRDDDKAFMLRELAGMHRRVTALQRALALLTVGLGLIALGEVLRFVALLL